MSILSFYRKVFFWTRRIFQEVGDPGIGYMISLKSDPVCEAQRVDLDAPDGGSVTAQDAGDDTHPRRIPSFLSSVFIISRIWHERLLTAISFPGNTPASVVLFPPAPFLSLPSLPPPNGTTRCLMFLSTSPQS